MIASPHWLTSDLKWKPVVTNILPKVSSLFDLLPRESILFDKSHGSFEVFFNFNIQDLFSI